MAIKFTRSDDLDKMFEEFATLPKIEKIEFPDEKEKKMKKEQGITIVLVTHQMNDVSDYADYVIVCEKGTVVKTGTPEEVFADAHWLQEKQLGLPSTIQFVEKLKAKGFSTEERPMTLDQLADLLVSHSNLGGEASAR